MTEHLTLEDLLAAADAALGRALEVRDYGLLQSALARPQATAFGVAAYPDLHTKVASLLHSLASNHALVDGNKRLAWVAVRLFYVLNEHDLHAPHDEAFDLVMAVAAGQEKDVTKIASVLTQWSVP